MKYFPCFNSGTSTAATRARPPVTLCTTIVGATAVSGAAAAVATATGDIAEGTAVDTDTGDLPGVALGERERLHNTFLFVLGVHLVSVKVCWDSFKGRLITFNMFYCMFSIQHSIALMQLTILINFPIYYILPYKSS